MNGRSIFNQSQGSVFCLSVQERFERQWRRGGEPNLPGFWKQMLSGQPTLTADVRQQLLWRLVEIDLDYRWSAPTGIAKGGSRTSPRREPWLLEEYSRHLPELGPIERFPVDVIAHEYRLRRTSGPNGCSMDEYAARFRNH